MPNEIFIGWVDHGRSTELAAALGASNVVIPSGKNRNVASRYLTQFRATLRALRSARARGVIFMQPPAPLQAAVLIGARSGARVVGDLHSGYFNDRKWLWFTRIGLWSLRRHAVIVTNEPMAQIARRAGVEKIFVLHDVLQRTFNDDPGERVRSKSILVPLSYAADEPIDEILQAARRVPRFTWELTGKAPAEIQASAPENVRFTGFVSDEEFSSLMHRAQAVLALTSRSDTMQRAGYEAMMAGTPVITSDHAVLRDFFGSTASYVTPDATSIAAAVDSMNPAAVVGELVAKLDQRVTEQRATLGELSDYLAKRVRNADN